MKHGFPKEEFVMEVVKSDLKSCWEMWSDPGIYPNNVAGYPQADRLELEEVTGSVEVNFDTGIQEDHLTHFIKWFQFGEAESISQLSDISDEFHDLVMGEVPSDVLITSWEIDFTADKIIVSPTEWEPNN